jgi:hypothetical protein
VTQVAQGLAALAGVWLIGLGVWMFAAPRGALATLAAMGSTARIQFGEMAIRGAVGLLFILAAPAARFSMAITLIGGFLLASAIVLCLLPRRWHAGYSRGWARRFSPLFVRGVAPFSILGGGVLIWSLFQSPFP